VFPTVLRGGPPAEPARARPMIFAHPEYVKRSGMSFGFGGG
jgi:hypothetical protein